MFFSTIFGGITTIKDWIWTVATFVAKLGDMIPHDIVSVIVHWILVIIVVAGISGGLGVLAFRSCKKYLDYFKKKQADEISVFVVLITLIIVVFMADQIKSILSINLFGLMLLICVFYTVVIGLMQAEDKEANKKIIKGVVIAIGGVGVIAVVFHFFGVIGLIAGI